MRLYGDGDWVDKVFPVVLILWFFCLWKIFDVGTAYGLSVYGVHGLGLFFTFLTLTLIGLILLPDKED